MNRHTIRLQGFDYGQRGVYYISISTHRARPLLGKQHQDTIVLSEAGHLVERLWRGLPEHYHGLRLDEFRIMPNHMHGILVLLGHPWPGQTEAFSQPTRHTIPTMMRCYKAACTREWRRQCGTSDTILWQGRYLDRVIRSRAELSTMRVFVRENLLWHRLQDLDTW